jgi:hypothetical protein
VRRLVIALLLLLTACGRDQDPTLPSTATSTPSTTATVPTNTTTTAAPSTTTTVAGLPATATCPAVPARAAPDPDRPSYQLDITLDLAGNAVEGRQVVRFTPDLATDRLVFRLWPNGPRASNAGARLDVGEVYLGSSAPVPTERPDATTLVVPLDSPLAAGETIEVTVPFRLTLPGPVNDRISRRGDTVRLGTFHPLLAWEPGVGWATPPPTALFAEATSSPVADWSMSVTVPDGLTVFASGALVDGRWRATAMREVAVAVGRFRVVEGIAGAPQRVPVTVAVETGMTDDANAYLNTAVRTLTDFGARYGAYPYDRYTLVLTPDLSGGIEYPAFVHQGHDTNARTTTHEVGHQWFYALVGNDQGRDPWLDEGFSSFAEARYLNNLSTFTGRSIPADARGRAGEPMAFWDAGHGSSYYRGVYVQGAQALAALGSPEQVDCALRHHVARHAHGIATNRSTIDALKVVFPDAEAVLGRYGIASR